MYIFDEFFSGRNRKRMERSSASSRIDRETEKNEKERVRNGRRGIEIGRRVKKSDGKERKERETENEGVREKERERERKRDRET